MFNILGLLPELTTAPRTLHLPWGGGERRLHATSLCLPTNIAFEIDSHRDVPTRSLHARVESRQCGPCRGRALAAAWYQRSAVLLGLSSGTLLLVGCPALSLLEQTRCAHSTRKEVFERQHTASLQGTLGSFALSAGGYFVGLAFVEELKWRSGDFECHTSHPNGFSGHAFYSVWAVATLYYYFAHLMLELSRQVCFSPIMGRGSRYHLTWIRNSPSCVGREDGA